MNKLSEKLKEHSTVDYKKSYHEIDSRGHLQVQLILIFYGSCIFELYHLLKFLCNHEINIHSAFSAIHRHVQSAKVLSQPSNPLPAKVNQGSALHLCFLCLVAEMTKGHRW